VSARFDAASGRSGFLQTAMQISGHKSASVFQRYNLADETSLANAAEKLPACKQPEAENPVDDESLLEVDRIAEAVDLAIELEDK
jgi:hypothetical protein